MENLPCYKDWYVTAQYYMGRRHMDMAKNYPKVTFNEAVSTYKNLIIMMLQKYNVTCLNQIDYSYMHQVRSEIDFRFEQILQKIENERKD